MIVVGVDGSERARHALRWAVAEAGVMGTGVIAVHAYPQMSELVEATEEASHRRDTARHVLDESITAAAVDGVEIRPVLVEGSPADNLIRLGESSDLLVVGRRGLGGFAGLLMGSTSHQCVRHARCPVAVIPYADGAGLPALRRVVVGVEGSDAAAAALRWATTCAERHDVPLAAAHAWQPPFPIGGLALEPGLPPLDLGPSAAAALDEALGDLRTTAPVQKMVVEGPTAQALLGMLTPDDVLVVGSRGRGGFLGLLLGSTSQQCAEHAPCPVVVVHLR